MLRSRWLREHFADFFFLVRFHRPQCLFGFEQELTMANIFFLRSVSMFGMRGSINIESASRQDHLFNFPILEIAVYLSQLAATLSCSICMARSPPSEVLHFPLGGSFLKPRTAPSFSAFFRDVVNCLLGYLYCVGVSRLP